jgi:hypothetical protein
MARRGRFKLLESSSGVEIMISPSLLGILIDITERIRQEERWKQISLEQSSQIESLMSNVEQAHKFAKRQEEDSRALQASLEMQISLRDVELKKRRNELQQQSTEREKAAHILLTKVSDLQNFVASTQQYLDSSREAL